MLWFMKKKIEKEQEEKQIVKKKKKHAFSYQHVSFVDRLQRFSSGERFKRF